MTAGRVKVEPRWRFEATVLRDVVVDGVKRYAAGDIIEPKGFYYNGPQDKWVVLVGNVLQGHTIRMKMPRTSVSVKVGRAEE